MKKGFIALFALLMCFMFIFPGPAPACERCATIDMISNALGGTEADPGNLAMANSGLDIRYCVLKLPITMTSDQDNCLQAYNGNARHQALEKGNVMKFPQVRFGT